MAEYLYCIIHRAPVNGFPEEGIEGGRPYALPYQDLCAIVSEAPLKDYEPDDDNMARHKDVELAVMKDHTVLPVAFGMVFKTKGVMVNTMRNVYPILKRSLRLIDNKIELGVKVIAPKEDNETTADECNETTADESTLEEVDKATDEAETACTDKAINEETEEDEKEAKEGIPLDTSVLQEITQDVKEDIPLVKAEETCRIHSADEFRIPESLTCRFESQSRDSGNLSTYLIPPALAGDNSDTSVLQEITQDVKEEDFATLDTSTPKEEPEGTDKAINEEDFTTLDKIAVEVRKGELFSDRLLYNKSFLVDRSDIERFSEEVERIRQKYNGCKIQYSGPWPPYNFVDIRIMGRRR